jgi:hypothetical protein
VPAVDARLRGADAAADARIDDDDRIMSPQYQRSDCLTGAAMSSPLLGRQEGGGGGRGGE